MQSTDGLDQADLSIIDHALAHIALASTLVELLHNLPHSVSRGILPLPLEVCSSVGLLPSMASSPQQHLPAFQEAVHQTVGIVREELASARELLAQINRKRRTILTPFTLRAVRTGWLAVAVLTPFLSGIRSRWTQWHLDCKSSNTIHGCGKPALKGRYRSVSGIAVGTVEAMYDNREKHIAQPMASLQDPSAPPLT